MNERFELHHGRCEDVLPLLPSKSIDLIFADLPYGMTACNWDKEISLDFLWIQYKRLLRTGGCVVLNGSQPFTSKLVASNLQWFKCEWIWEKSVGSNFATTKWYPMKEHESVLFFAPALFTYNPQFKERSESGAARVRAGHKTIGTKKGEGAAIFGHKRNQQDPLIRVPSSIVYFPVEKGLHPNQKPVSMCRYFIETYSNRGDCVLDNTMGSGSTGVAAIETGRNFVGIEMEKGYLEIAKRRISNAASQTSIFDFIDEPKIEAKQVEMVL